MRAMTDFMASFPDIQLDVDFTSPTVDVIESGYDVAIQTGDWADSRLMTRTLGSYRLMLVGSPEYLARRTAPITMEDLARHDCLHHRDPADGKLTRWPLRAAEGEDWLAPPAKAVATAIRPLIAMTEAGLGLACLPDFTVQSQLRNGTLVQVLGELIDHQDSFRAVWPTSRHLSPKTRAFIDFMADRLLSPPACAGLQAYAG